MKLKRHVQKLCEEINALTEEIKEQRELYHSFRQGANMAHNAGSQRCVDGDEKGAMRSFALRDRHQEEWQKALRKAEKLEEERDKLRKKLDKIPLEERADWS